MRNFAQLGEEIDILLINAQAYEIDNKGNRWEMTAGKILYNMKAGTVVFANLETKTFPNDGEAMQISSKEGLLDTNTKTMVFSQSVNLTTAAGVSLLTEKLLYEADTKKLSSDEEVLIATGTAQVFGRGVRFFLGDKDFKILSTVRAEFSR